MNNILATEVVVPVASQLTDRRRIDIDTFFWSLRRTRLRNTPLIYRSTYNIIVIIFSQESKNVIKNVVIIIGFKIQIISTDIKIKSSIKI